MRFPPTAHRGSGDASRTRRSCAPLAAAAGVAAALLVALAGCGESSAGGAAACREEARRAAEAGLSMVRHYATEIYPADMSYLGMKGSLDLFAQAGCPGAILGRALEARLKPAERQTLVSLLPPGIAHTVRDALAAA